MLRRDFAFGTMALLVRRPMGIQVGTPIPLAEDAGDTWVAAWAGDDALYTPSNDTHGFRNAANGSLEFNRLDGHDPSQLSGSTVNPMPDYSKLGQEGGDGCNWKSSGCGWIDGALYRVVARHKYGEKSGDANRRQTAANAGMIKPTDFGRTSVRSAQENYGVPMFPGRRFATPYFIEFGHERDVDGSGRYVCAVSNNGWWDNGDDMLLGRVARAKIGGVKGSDWEFHTGGDGRQDRSSSGKMSGARPLLASPGQFGMTGAVYLPTRRRYLMIAWHYPASGGKIKGAEKCTVWNLYEAPRPWGPWTRAGSHESRPQGFYSPGICPKFQTAKRIWGLAAGDWTTPSSYRLHMVPVDQLQLRPQRRQGPSK